jgi:hypothetical protein
VGDFGLATVRKGDGTGQRALAGARGSTMHPQDSTSADMTEKESCTEDDDGAGLSGSITGGVGTTFYIAPEQERLGMRYNEKAGKA